MMSVPGASTQDQVSPNVVRRLFQQLVSSDFKTVYKGQSWQRNINKNKDEAKECFCKNGMCCRIRWPDGVMNLVSIFHVILTTTI